MRPTATRPIPALIATALATTALVASALAATSVQTPTWPNDLSPSGVRAAISIGNISPAEAATLMPEEVLNAARDYAAQLRKQGITSQSGRVSINAATPVNVNANSNHVGDAIGETQGEIAVGVNGDTVVVGWNDSRGFVAGNTVSSYSYSTNGGASFVDGGNVPLALATDQCFGDPSIDTDGAGNWYSNQIYTRTLGNPGATAQQNIGVHHGRFNGAGVLVWDLPTMAIIGAGAGAPIGSMDKCLLACDRLTGNVYVAATRLGIAVSQIEIARSTTLGASWTGPIVLDATSTPTTAKQSARPFCGPAGEVYVVWEKGANSIFCADGAGNVSGYNGAQIAFTRSLDFGVTYAPLSVISGLTTGFLASGPGDLRERGNEFPDIGVDRSGGANNGNLYVTWHDTAPWSANTLAGPVKTELVATNNNPGTPDLVAIGDDASGAITPAGDLDYWQFSATQGQNLLIELNPQAWNCGVAGTTRGMRLRLFATQAPYPNPTGFPDTLLVGSFNGAFVNRVVWTAPKTGNYLIRLQISSGTTTGTYIMRLRPLTFSPTAARDARDVVVSRSSDQGGTWSTPALVNDDAAGLENRRPFISVDGRGHVHIFWHDSRTPGLGTNASLTNIFATTSKDGGLTWSPNYCVTNELSFFSFNTLAVPNLGDYNQAASSGDRTWAAWTDQRLSTGDIRTPGTNTFTAGLGPEAYTAMVRHNFSVACPPPVLGNPGASVVLNFTINNTGTVPGRFDYNVSDGAGWIPGGPIIGVTPVIAAGGSFNIAVKFDIPANCTPPVTTATLCAAPVGDASKTTCCDVDVLCDLSTDALVSTFEAVGAGEGVELGWNSAAVNKIQSWILERAKTAFGGYERVIAAPIPMGMGGSFRIRDESPMAGESYYRLSAVFTDGSQRAIQTLRYNGTPGTVELRLVGANPFGDFTTLAYSVAQRSQVRIEVFTVAGQRVRTLVDRTMEPGNYTQSFDRTVNGRTLEPGMYFVKMTAGNATRTLRVMTLQ